MRNQLKMFPSQHQMIPCQNTNQSCPLHPWGQSCLLVLQDPISKSVPLLVCCLESRKMSCQPMILSRKQENYLKMEQSSQSQVAELHWGSQSQNLHPVCTANQHPGQILWKRPLHRQLTASPENPLRRTSTEPP